MVTGQRVLTVDGRRVRWGGFAWEGPAPREARPRFRCQAEAAAALRRVVERSPADFSAVGVILDDFAMVFAV